MLSFISARGSDFHVLALSRSVDRGAEAESFLRPCVQADHPLPLSIDPHELLHSGAMNWPY